jgi:hypothetical protein
MKGQGLGFDVLSYKQMHKMVIHNPCKQTAT